MERPLERPLERPWERIVVLTGAGISRESGLETFRDGDGLWSRYAIEDVCTPHAFHRDPLLVDRFYNDRRAELWRVRPNDAHLALARLEHAARAGEWDGEILIVTQNIDDLHERAGSRNVVHMHGELLRVRCTACGATPDWQENCLPQTPCPICHRPALRPDVVWFGEIPLHMERIQAALDRCDRFVSIGTSGTVYPAAGFVAQVRDHADTLDINLEAPAVPTAFERSMVGAATRMVPRWVDEVLAG
ncbi:Silent information regulator protein Sir2 [Gluconacetobacter diazotrophicus PA1 5]|nr:NAD-dependent deacylase [Gluconacetobacter diazotrophicus]ACI50061.1 Silent information regulator protein Sir2 [Gluconacetobacter diazotrophicus PA1 5]MBB2156245.1 NAD-dependent deacylase [Gluconacetobacter diazotrophicus]TWB07859.1 NAD-dependent deacetylase [Gluconacetobacter diazotrophicus]